MWKNNSLRQVFGISLAIFGLIFAAFGPAGMQNALAEPVSPSYLTIDNFQNGETLGYDLPLLKGTAPGSNTVSITSVGADLTYPVHDGRWRGFFPLENGQNNLTISTSSGFQFAFTLNYQPMANSHQVRLVYMLGSDSSGIFDAPVNAPNDLQFASTRIALSGRILQSLTAELLYEKGLPRQTFQLMSNDKNQPVVDTPRIDKSIAELRQMDGVDLWYYLYDLFADIPRRDDVIDMTMIADTHYDPETETLQAHTALGGGRLGLFGSSTLYTFPDTVAEITGHFMDAAPIETYLNPELGRSKSYWAAYTTSLGAMLHEMGHCFNLPHPEPPEPGNIMHRGFDYLNRMVVTFEPGLGPVDPATAIMPDWTDGDAEILQANPWFSLASSGDGTGGPVLIPGEMKLSIHQIALIAETSIPITHQQPVRVDINRPGVTWAAQVSQMASLPVQLSQLQGQPGESFTISLSSLDLLAGTYTNEITVTASDSTILGSPMVIPITLVVSEPLSPVYLPLVTGTW